MTSIKVTWEGAASTTTLNNRQMHLQAAVLQVVYGRNYTSVTTAAWFMSIEESRIYVLDPPDCRNISTSLFHYTIPSTQSSRCLGSSTGSSSRLPNGSIIHGCVWSLRTSSTSPLPSSRQIPHHNFYAN